VELDSLGCTAIRSDGAVAINLCSSCIVDLRGNPAGTKIIQAGGPICIFGVVLTDPGVTPESLMDPAPLISQSALPCTDAYVAVTNPLPHAGVGVRLQVESRNPNRIGRPLDYVLELDRGPASVWLELFDAAGRRLARSGARVLPAGIHRGVWTPQTASDAAPGVYFVVAKVNGIPRATARWVLVH
jgi:hypothetical protein